jgi:hypothetical protein
MQAPFKKMLVLLGYIKNIIINLSSLWNLFEHYGRSTGRSNTFEVFSFFIFRLVENFFPKRLYLYFVLALLPNDIALFDFCRFAW